MSAPEHSPTTRRHLKSLPRDVETLAWAAEWLGISANTAYRRAAAGQLPGAFRASNTLWRISVPRFFLELHGDDGARLLAEAWHEDARVES